MEPQGSIDAITAKSAAGKQPVVSGSSCPTVRLRCGASKLPVDSGCPSHGNVATVAPSPN